MLWGYFPSDIILDFFSIPDKFHFTDVVFSNILTIVYFEARL